MVAPDNDKVTPLASRRRPEVATRHLLASTTGTLYAAGGAFALLAALTAPASSAVLITAALTALTSGVAVLRWGSALPHAWMHVLVAAGSLLSGVAVVSAPDPVTACVLAVLFTFPAIDTHYYFARRPALAQLLMLLVVAGASLLLRGASVWATSGLLVALTAVALVVGELADRASDASRDALTGLLNRRGTDDALDAAVLEAQRSGTPLTVVLLDVDRFKAVNDTQGHAAGDALLRGIAQDLRRSLPAAAVIGRTGGDEFVALLPGLDDDAALAVVQGAHASVRHPLSVGLVGHLPAESTGDVLHRADAALYAAKRGGRDRVVRGDAASSHLVRDLAAALDSPASGGLHVALQPVVRAGTSAVVAVEALLQWDHPVRGTTSPADVVAASGGSDLAPRLGAFLLDRACAEAAPLRRLWGHHLTLHVSASRAELSGPGYVDGVLARLADAGWSADRLVVRIDDDAVAAVAARAADVVSALTELRRAGVRTAVGYGSSRSSLARLVDLPADVVVLDAAVVASASTSARRRTVVRAVLGVEEELGLVAVAEGVDTAELAELVEGLGCPLAQGSAHGSPASAAVLLAAGAPVPAAAGGGAGAPVA